jgi:transcription initiation factor TFIID subunit 11
MSDQEEIQETRKRKFDEDEHGDEEEEEDEEENTDAVQMKTNKDDNETVGKKDEESDNNNNDDEEKKSNEDDEEKNNLDRSFDISSSEDEEDEEEEGGDYDENFDIFEALNKTEPNTIAETNNAMLMMSKMNRDEFDEAAQLLDFDKSDQFDDITSLKKIKTTGGDGKSESEGQSEDISKSERNNLKIESMSKDLSSGEKQRLKKQAADNSAKELARRKKLEQIEEESKKMQVLIANFSEEQLNRYEIFRRSAFPKSSVKKIIQTVCGKTVSASVVIAMSGIAKVFVGEIVEKALDIKLKWNDTNGPLQPKHLRESFRIYKNNNKILTSNRAKRPSMFV